nr:YdcF family protein [Robertmurraya korlensis]
MARKVIVSGYILFLISFFIVEGLILREAYLKDKYNKEEIDFVIILGAGLRGEEPSKTLQGRLDAGLSFLLDNRDIPVIVSGGQGPGEAITEAEAMGTFLVENGVEKGRVYYESRSTDTNENLKFSSEMMTELGVEKPKILIITSDYHVFRSKLLAEEYGLTPFGLGGDSPFFVKLNYYIREYFGVVKDFVL